jgi:hypothetical protein
MCGKSTSESLCMALRLAFNENVSRIILNETCIHIYNQGCDQGYVIKGVELMDWKDLIVTPAMDLIFEFSTGFLSSIFEDGPVESLCNLCHLRSTCTNPCLERIITSLCKNAILRYSMISRKRVSPDIIVRFALKEAWIFRRKEELAILKDTETQDKKT